MALSSKDLKYLRFFKSNIARCAEQCPNPHIILGLTASLIIGILHTHDSTGSWGAALSDASDVIYDVEDALQSGDVDAAYAIIRRISDDDSSDAGNQ